MMIVGVFLVLARDAHSQDESNRHVLNAPSPSSPSASAATGETNRPAGGLNIAPYETSGPGVAGHIADFFQDQKQIWTSPARVRLSDATWLVPLGGLAAGLFATDRQYNNSLSKNSTTMHHYQTVSNLGVASLVGTSAGLYLGSYFEHNEHWRETGLLAGEAALNSLVTVEALKYFSMEEHRFPRNTPPWPGRWRM